MKYSYIDSNIEWIGQIPEHWKIDRIKDGCKKVTGGGTPKSGISAYWDEGEIIWISPTDFSKSENKIIEDSEKKITPLGLKKSSANLLPIGTVIMSSRASIGEVKIAGKELSTNQGFVSFLPQKDLYNNFLYYVIKGFLGEYFSEIASGTTFMEISRRMVQLEKIPLPPLPEQRAIASYLDQACARIDRIIEIKEKQIRKIKTQRKNRINEVVRFGLVKEDSQKTNLDYLPEIKKGWQLDRFKDVALQRTEKTDEKSELKDYLELEDIAQGSGKILNKRDSLEVASKITKFYKGDVLFGKLRPYLEKYLFVDFDGKCTGEILAFEPTRVDGKFLMYILASNWFISLCNSMSYGAKMPRVNWNTQLSKIYLPLPTESEQKEIVSHLDQLSEKTFRISSKLKTQIKTLKTYRESLIHECVTGKKQVYKNEQAATKLEPTN